MRVLISTVGAYGHLHPVLPLAHALRQAGHEVAIATGPDLSARAEAAGFSAFAVGLPIAAAFARLAERHPDQVYSRLAPDEILGWYLPHLFGEILAPAAMLDLQPLVSGWQPDLIVHDVWEFGAPVAAARAGIPSVSHTLGLRFDDRLVESTAQSVAPLWREYGLQPDPTGGLYRWMCLDIMPPSLQPDAAAQRACMPLRPVSPAALPSEALPEWINQRRNVPLVYMTLGTNTNSDVSMFRAAVAGLAEAELDLQITVGPGRDPACVGALPNNVHVASYVAQSLLLPLCSAVICHAGAGTTLAALAGGLPVLMLPQGADQYVFAERVVASGAGVRLLPAEVNASSIRASMESVLADDPYRALARAVQVEIAAMPGPDRAAALVEQIGLGWATTLSSSPLAQGSHCATRTLQRSR